LPEEPLRKHAEATTVDATLDRPLDEGLDDADLVGLGYLLPIALLLAVARWTARRARRRRYATA